MIQRKSEMVGLNITVAADNSVNAEATYASGAWDGDKQEWVGQPHMLTEPFNSFAHDAGRIKSIVGQMLLRVAQGHEVLKGEHGAEKLAHGQVRFDLQNMSANYDRAVREARAADVTNHNLRKENRELWSQLNAQPVARKNPLLHRLTGGRAGR